MNWRKRRRRRSMQKRRRGESAKNTGENLEKDEQQTQELKLKGKGEIGEEKRRGGNGVREQGRGKSEKSRTSRCWQVLGEGGSISDLNTCGWREVDRGWTRGLRGVIRVERTASVYLGSLKTGIAARRKR